MCYKEAARAAFPQILVRRANEPRRGATVNHRSNAPFLLAGRIVCVLAGSAMFALSVYWQRTYVPPPDVAGDAAWHPFFVFIAVIGLAIIAASLSSRPARVLAVIPVGAPAGLWCLFGNGPVEAMGYAFLVTVAGAALVYQGCKGLKARSTVRGVVR